MVTKQPFNARFCPFPAKTERSILSRWIVHLLPALEYPKSQDKNQYFTLDLVREWVVSIT